jgi:hypothetical protein
MIESLLNEYPEILDKRGRINANLHKHPRVNDIEAAARSLCPTLPDKLVLTERLRCIKLGITHWPKCEMCPNLALWKGNGTFRTFCSVACSRHPDSSTFAKVKATNLARYGVSSNLASKEAIQRRRESGGCGLANPVNKQKATATNLKRYGVANVFQAAEIKQRIAATHDQRFGGNYQTMKLGEKIALLEDAEYCRELAKNHCLSAISELLGVATNTVYRYFEQHGITSFNRTRSNYEVMLKQFLEELQVGQIVVGSRHIIAPLELDLVVPDLNLAIELHGNYWHSSKAGAKPNYMVNKLERAEAAGLRLIQIFESELVLQRDIVLSRLRAACSRTRRIGARTCQVVMLDSKQKSEFLTKTHLQGDCASSVALGLVNADGLVACMTFGKSRFDKAATWELLRFSTAIDTSVVGGFSKLLKAFTTQHSGSIVSYADRRWSSGAVYKRNGFKLAGISKPTYHYFKGSSLVLENRVKYQKHKLQKCYRYSIQSCQNGTT